MTKTNTTLLKHHFWPLGDIFCRVCLGVSTTLSPITAGQRAPIDQGRKQWILTETEICNEINVYHKMSSLGVNLFSSCWLRTLTQGAEINHRRHVSCSVVIGQCNRTVTWTNHFRSSPLNPLITTLITITITTNSRDWLCKIVEV